MEESDLLAIRRQKLDQLRERNVAAFGGRFDVTDSIGNVREGISRRHNPEFTMLEAYWAYADFELMANLVEELICTLAESEFGSLRIEHRNEDGEVRRTIDLTNDPSIQRQRLLHQVGGEIQMTSIDAG